MLELVGRTKPYVLAHRGNRAHCPENTAAAFSRAFLNGADILETDLHLTRDGAFVCIHDSTVDRTTDGRGPVAGFSLDQLKGLNAAAGHEGFGRQSVLTLEELGSMLPVDVAVALELKTDRFLEREVCQRFVDILSRLGIRGRTVLLSFSWPRVQAVRSVAPDIPGGWITVRSAWPARTPQVLGPFWPLLLANPLYVAIAHRRKQVVSPLDPGPDGRLWLYQLLGCDAVLSDDPGSTCRRLGRPTRSEEDLLTLRIAGPADWAAVKALYDEAGAWLHDVKGITDQWDREMSDGEVRQLVDSGRLYLAYLGPQLAGAVELSEQVCPPFEGLPGQALYAGSLAVRRCFAGKGLGARILDWTVEVARSRGKGFVRLDCMAANPALVQYYRHLGFASLGRHPEHTWYWLFEKPVR